MQVDYCTRSTVRKNDQSTGMHYRSDNIAGLNLGLSSTSWQALCLTNIWPKSMEPIRLPWKQRLQGYVSTGPPLIPKPARTRS